MATMQAIRIHGFGGPEMLVQDTCPVPQASGDKLLIRVRAASVNPVDYKMRQGRYPPLTADMLPVTLGRDIAGTIEAGEAGGYRRGDAVFAMLAPDQGGYAEYALARADEVAITPARIDAVHAAALPLAGLTAWQGLFDHGQLQAGQRVLIHGGGGGVGHLAVQFARVHGAVVFATVGTHDLDFMQELGVDRAIDRNVERFEDVAGDLDLVFDLIGGETQRLSLSLLRPGGRLVSTLAAPSPDECQARGVSGLRYAAQPSGRQLAEIAALIDEGHVRVEVAERFPLARAAAAQERLEAGGVRGKIVLEIG